MFILPKFLTTRDICLIAALTAVCVGGSYALVGLPNINLMDLVVFVTGFVFGPFIGATTGILAWAVYGVLNPLGFSLPIWASTMIGEALFGIFGGLVAKISYKKLANPFDFKFSLETSLWGLFLTIAYDLSTNLVFTATFGVPIVASFVTGWLIPPWFGFMHEGSNMLFFFVGVHPLVRAMRMIRGGERIWPEECDYSP